MYNVNKNFFECIDCELKAYWLGFLFADGCIVECKNPKTNKLKAMRIQLSLADVDLQHLENFKTDLNSDAPISHNKTKLNGETYYNSKICICNTKMCRDLIKFNCIPRKSLILKYPVGQIPEMFECDFIRGYFDGDGSISLSYDKYGKHTLYSSILGTDDMCEHIQQIFNKHNIVSYKHCYKNSIPELRISGKNNIYNYYNFMYRDGDALRYLDRKLKKFQYIFNTLNIGV